MTRKIGLLFVTLLVLSGTILTSVSAEITKNFSEPTTLGSPIQSVAIYDSSFGVENGRQVMYTTSSGSPAIFQVVDLQSREVLRSFPLEGSSSSWTHITLPNGMVYIGGNGLLYEYSPETMEVTNVGDIGESVIYGLTYDEHGNVYFGSYPNAKIGRYNPNTGEMYDYGNVAPGQNYTRSTAYHDGFIYAGVGINGFLSKLNVETGEVEQIELPDGAISGSTNIWQLEAAGKWIVAGIGGGNNALLFYDTVTGEWSETFYTGNKGLRLVPSKPGEKDTAYFLQGTNLMEINLDTLELTNTGVQYGTFLRNTTWLEVPNDPELPGLSLATVAFGGSVAYMNLETGKVKSVQYPIIGNPIPIQTLENGPDDMLYMSGYPGGEAARMDIETGKSEEFALGQAEGMAFIGNNMYMGVYPKALIVSIDVTKPLPTAIPKETFGIEGQDRPFIMTPANGKLFIGTIPEYGLLGGSLTIYDSVTGDVTEYENVVENQSIAGLAELNGKLYGSTTVAGGLGIPPSETEAKIFVWDIKTEQKITEFVPEIPGATVQPDMISGMKLGPDGLLWAAADGNIFAMDPESLEIVKSKNIYPDVTSYGMWRPVQIRFAEDGTLYTTLAGNLTIINPETLEHVTLDQTELMTIGIDGNIYYTKDANVMKIEVTNIVYLEDVLTAVQTYTDARKLENSLSKQLTNSIKQAIHHRNHGNIIQASHFQNKALYHLTKSKLQKTDPDIYEELQRIIQEAK